MFEKKKKQFWAVPDVSKCTSQENGAHSRLPEYSRRVDC